MLIKHRNVNTENGAGTSSHIKFDQAWQDFNESLAPWVNLKLIR